MGFTLLDRPNPYGPHYYTTRNQPLLAIVVHVTAGAEDLDTLDDLSAENVAAYAGTTDREVSWHSGSDADSWVSLLPAGYTAWHATSYNSTTYGHEISKRTTDWRGMPAVWTDKTLGMAALGPDGSSGLRKIALDNGIPLRWATRTELDAQIANYRAGRQWQRVGFITHHEVQPADRTDPGYVYEAGHLIDTFPRERFMALLNLEDDVIPQELIDAPLYGRRRSDTDPRGYEEYNTTVGEVFMDLHAATFQGHGWNLDWGPGVLPRLGALEDVVAELKASGVPVNLTLSEQDKADIARLVVAEFKKEGN